MQVLRPGIGEEQRLRRRIIAIDGGPRHVAFGQAHHLAALEIDGGEYDHAGFHSRKRASSSSPYIWLFSGWNCTPRILSRATAATSPPP